VPAVNQYYRSRWFSELTYIFFILLEYTNILITVLHIANLPVRSRLENTEHQGPLFAPTYCCAAHPSKYIEKIISGVSCERRIPSRDATDLTIRRTIRPTKI